MSSSRYILEKYKGPSSRFRCPVCGQAREFSRYIDTTTGQPVAESVGRCNRIDRCGHHLTPREYFSQNGISMSPAELPTPENKPAKELFTIPLEKMEATLGKYTENSFAICLRSAFGEKETVRLLAEYQCIGTSARHTGAVIFWQIDTHGQVRTGKVMRYGSDFHRDKSFPPTWAHCGLIPDHLELRQCFFGEHQLALKPESMPVAICESEKTAVLCTHFLPQFIWLAAGNLQGITERKIQALRGRKVVLYPDLGAGYSTWSKKARELQHVTEIKVSDYLERIATAEQKKNGLDLADYLLANKNLQIA